MANATEEFGDGRSGGSGTDDDDSEFRGIFAGDSASIDEGGGDDDSGSVLVVVEDGDPYLLERFFDMEAGGGGDVFEVDSAEGWGDGADGMDDFFGVLS